MNPRLALALVCVCAPCWAQTAAALSPAASRASPTPTERGEPNVKHIVIEDDGARIDELRVRGQTQQVTVTPKGAITKPYEIVVPRGGRDVPDASGANGTNGAAGKRVWNVLKF